MQLLFFCPRWGQAGTNWDVFLKAVKDSGYDGIEASLPDSKSEAAEMQDRLAKYGLLLIGQHWQTLEPVFEKHIMEFEEHLQRLANVNPLFINSQTGKDYYSHEENKKLLNLANEIESKTAVPIIHETHRGKFSFAAHITRQFLEELPDLRLTLDISHWCNTAESLLQDQATAVDLAIARTDHIHARVGFPEGPQVTDPRDPAWQEAMNFHLACWDKVVELKKSKNEVVTITPEFGPHPYMVNLPFTQQAVADQWDINKYMMNLLRGRYLG